MNVQKNDNKGFTIIEVVLVLAIAGLIFLMVFLALPALQRGQRDGQRKSDLGRVQTAVQNYQSNNRNRLPAFTGTLPGGGTFTEKYLTVDGDTFIDPAGAGTSDDSATSYVFRVTDTVPTDFDAAQNNIYVSVGRTCDGEAIRDAGSTKVALRMKLEGGGISCVNN